MHTEVSASGVSSLYPNRFQIKPEERILEAKFGKAFFSVFIGLAFFL
jgi:protein-S-isoprenylcysteine O-methyltransferase Ste14